MKSKILSRNLNKIRAFEKRQFFYKICIKRGCDPGDSILSNNHVITFNKPGTFWYVIKGFRCFFALNIC